MPHNMIFILFNIIVKRNKSVKSLKQVIVCRVMEVTRKTEWDKQQQRVFCDYIDRRTWQTSDVIMSGVVL